MPSAVNWKPIDYKFKLILLMLQVNGESRIELFMFYVYANLLREEKVVFFF